MKDNDQIVNKLEYPLELIVYKMKNLKRLETTTSELVTSLNLKMTGYKLKTILNRNVDKLKREGVTFTDFRTTTKRGIILEYDESIMDDFVLGNLEYFNRLDKRLLGINEIVKTIKDRNDIKELGKLEAEIFALYYLNLPNLKNEIYKTYGKEN